ncbi:ADP-ribosylglycohydrolase family protein [Roseateles terrae]|uniref:ADP-ribosyl-[dinitrogen reductase] hydrolase n=1 Tax=Roseateles terrae TaxID=431060 RepID=A0ABR6GUZ0_9BURK|nr:ADP-ribosylglycohydrolase family protein [Roseateles terrae]MBB3195932.1 ADP-ribosyl-[dinitrogen reductase] hydrolase [Roseateles terrae]OWQ85578.1 ADP-ribosylglycohydrolase [Roseateles terrae]
MEAIDRYRGALLGLACGDAVGTNVEFMPRGSFAPVTDMLGGGPFSLAPGKWTDDTSMALCLAESLIQTGRCDPADQMARYANWYEWGYWSSTGVCFDIGITTKGAIHQFLLSGEALSGPSDPNAAGNGSLMRIAPIALRFGHDEQLVQDMAALSSRTTHGATECLDACRVFAVALSRALRGLPKEKVLDLGGIATESAKVRAIAAADHATKSVGQIKGSGYVVDSLEAALWCYARHNNFRDTILEAVNLGDDADTTAAIVGQIACATYGMAGIPPSWLGRLHLTQEITHLADALYRARSEALAGI